MNALPPAVFAQSFFVLSTLHPFSVRPGYSLDSLVFEANQFDSLPVCVKYFRVAQLTWLNFMPGWLILMSDAGEWHSAARN